MATPQITAWRSGTHIPPLAPLRARLRRLGIVLLVVCNVAAAGIAVFGANAVLTNPGSTAPTANPSVAAAAENAEEVRGFYAAVNEAIGTGDTGPLNVLVAQEIDWCRPCPAQAPGREGLKRYVADLHRASPEMRLVVDEVVGGLLETVVVRVRVSGYPVAGAASPWGPVDTLRLAYGQVVERRHGSDGATLAEPLLGTRLDALPAAVTGVVLARLTFPVGAELNGLLSAGPTMLVVETGTLRIHIASGGQILRAAGQVKTTTGDAGTPKDAMIEATLGPGDGAVVPAAVRHSLRQVGAEPVVVVGATLTFQGDGSDRSGSLHLMREGFEPIDGASPAQDSLPPTVRILLSERVDAWTPRPVRVAIGRAILGPGARVFPPGGETLFVAVESGTLALTGRDPRTVAAGMGMMEPPGLDRALRNAGPGLSALLVLTVAPAAE